MQRVHSTHKQPSSELARADGNVTRPLTPKKSAANEPIGRIDSKLLAKVASGKGVCDIQKNQTIFCQGDVAESVFYIQRGRVKLAVVSPQGKEAVVALLEPKSFFGEGCLSGQTHRVCTAVAIAACSLVRVERQAMLRFLSEQPSFAGLFLEYLLSRNIRIEEDLIDQLFNSSERRLARALLLLAHFGKDGSPEAVTPSISQETLAEMVGTTRSRVSFFMNKFRRLGLIDYNGGLQVRVHRSLLDFVLRD